jgi:lactoylglutathione lyase
MTEVALNLVVLRCSDLDRAVEFYSNLGLKFARHRHGNGQEHFAAELPGAVFELYPLSSDGQSSAGTRIGFRVPSLDAAITSLTAAPASIVSPPKQSEWGRRAVVKDPDGHRVELIEL